MFTYYHIVFYCNNMILFTHPNVYGHLDFIQFGHFEQCENILYMSFDGHVCVFLLHMKFLNPGLGTVFGHSNLSWKWHPDSRDGINLNDCRTSSTKLDITNHLILGIQVCVSYYFTLVLICFTDFVWDRTSYFNRLLGYHIF